MRVCIFMAACVTLLLSACHPIVVRVGTRTQGMEAEPPLSPYSTTHREPLPNETSVENFLQHLDDIKQLGRDALLKRYHQDGREQIRRVFRHFRDAVGDAAQREGLRPLPYLDDLEAGTCLPIDTQDIFGLDAFGDLRALLETAFLGGIPGDVDTLTKLGLFELGIAMDGRSFYEETPSVERQGSDLRWKVIHEQNEPDAWAGRDAQGVILHFLRTREASRHGFSLDAQVGTQVYEDASQAALPGLWLDFVKQESEPGVWSQIMLMQTGWRDVRGKGGWRDLGLSRRFVITQDRGQGHVLHMTASEHWQKPEEFHKKFRLDWNARSLCADVGDL